MDRMPTVAGQFYPGDPFRIKELVQKLLQRPEDIAAPDSQALLAMLPHAGYIFSGPTAGKALSLSGFDGTLIMLGPNHTGMGQKLSVWHDGTWRFPGGGLPVDSQLASALCSAEPLLHPDRAAHLKEHSLEVIIPLLYYLNPKLNIIPISVSEPDFHKLSDVAANMAKVIKAWPGKVSLLVSSDMSHYISADQAKRQDHKAIEQILAMDPMGLYTVVREENITMCGVLAMTLGLLVAKALGLARAKLVDYANSGQITGETEQVVGYASILAW